MPTRPASPKEPPGLDWEDLRTFLAVARQGSLTRAARQLGLTQPSVGRRLAALERRIGAPLFERTTAGLVPTLLAQAMLEGAERMESGALSIDRTLASADERLQGTITLTCIDWVGSRVLAPLLADFGLRHPGLTLRVMGDARNYSLTRREADLALRFVPFQQLDLAQRRLAAVPTGLYAAPGYLERHGPLDFGRGLAGHRILNLHEGAAHVPEYKWLRDRAPRAHMALRSNNVETLLTAAEAGAGITVLARVLGDASPRLVPVPTPEPLPHRDLWLGVHEHLRHLPRIRALIDFLAGHVERALAGEPPRTGRERDRNERA